MISNFFVQKKILLSRVQTICSQFLAQLKFLLQLVSPHEHRAKLFVVGLMFLGLRFQRNFEKVLTASLSKYLLSAIVTLSIL